MTVKLEQVAEQLGLRPDDAVRALGIGARMLAHGFIPEEIDYMVRTAYEERAFDERCIKGGHATPEQLRRARAREARNP
ncbi:hypothetical protein [Microbacterium sp. 69-7]|uniref:hypothetical protein n=1 Tax=Microbacterium sp. 69-7 TaxID=1895784 RepID=UPI000ACEBF08|nr:hypothetical protein [Microbacterium sp. 69-7]